MFEKNYHIYLARRLLNRYSSSKKNERELIKKLKQESGYFWTKKLESMLMDIYQSKKLIKYLKHKKKIYNNINVIICTQGNWFFNKNKNYDCQFEINKKIIELGMFYEKKYL